MAKFCKLFEVNDGKDHLLIEKTDDEEVYQIRVVTEVAVETGAVMAECKLGYRDEDKRDHEFDIFDQVKADEFRKALEAQVTGE